MQVYSKTDSQSTKSIEQFNSINFDYKVRYEDAVTATRLLFEPADLRSLNEYLKEISNRAKADIARAKLLAQWFEHGPKSKLTVQQWIDLGAPINARGSGQAVAS